MIVSSSATHQPELAPLAYDREAGTRWTSGTAMTPVMAWWCTFDKPVLISGVHASAGVDTDNPRKWLLSILDSDGGHGRREVASGAGVVSATFAPVRGQVVRIEQTGEDSYFWWSISELTIDATDIVIEEPPPVVPPVVPVDPDVIVGPMALEEPAARYLVEQLAKAWGWVVGEPCFVTGPYELLVTQSIAYPILRNKGDGIFEPFPFEIN